MSVMRFMLHNVFRSRHHSKLSSFPPRLYQHQPARVGLLHVECRDRTAAERGTSQRRSLGIAKPSGALSPRAGGQVGQSAERGKWAKVASSSMDCTRLVRAVRLRAILLSTFACFSTFFFFFFFSLCFFERKKKVGAEISVQIERGAPRDARRRRMDFLLSRL